MKPDEQSTAPDGPRRSPEAAVELGDRLLKGRIYEQLFPSLSAPAPRLGRFTLLRELGRGGMGVVYAAYDGQLDRKVAIKVLHAEASSDEAARSRLLREAQALARLSHPNVVQVHEAGVHDERVYLVMEFVQGQTLRRWLEEPRWSEGNRRGRRGRSERWRAVLKVLVEAGEGLAAAHDAGLTHRDFKPDNVLVGDDGRARVLDFGLATEGEVKQIGADTGEDRGADTEGAADETAGDDRVVSGSTQRPLVRVTRTGVAVGTLAYMPLEQWRGVGVDARSDQFSFCVTLYEALFGERPFVGRTRAEIAVALEDGQPRIPMSASTVPRWLRRALWRGLAKEPGDRYPDMRALLGALTGPMRARQLGVVSAAFLVAAGIGLGFGVSPEEVAAPEPCAASDRAMDEVWHDDAQGRLMAVLEPDVAAFASTAITGWSEQWRAAARTACEQVHVEQIASAQSLDTRGRCLDERQRTLSHVLQVMERERFDGPQVVGALAVLEAPADCLLDRADPLAGLSEVQLRRHETLSERLLELNLVQRGRSVAERRAEVGRIYEDAEREGLDAVQADAALLSGRLAGLAADRPQTDLWLGRAIDLGERRDLERVRILAWLLVAEATLFVDLEPERARWIWERAWSSAQSLPASHELRAYSEVVHGRILLGLGDSKEAARVADAAIEELRALGPTASLYLGHALRLRALMANRHGDGEAALKLTEQARTVERWDVSGGGDEATLGTELFDEGLARLTKGDLAGARAALERAREQIERELPRSRRHARVHTALSAVADAAGQVEVARVHAETADAIIRELGGPADPERIDALSALGTVAYRGGQFDDAARTFDLALRIGERTEEPGSVNLGYLTLNLAEARLAQGRLRQAERLLEEAVSVLERKLGPTHPDMAIAYKARGGLYVEQGRYEAAESELRAALALHQTSDEGSVEAAQSHWLLAKTLQHEGRMAEAVEHARAAQGILKDLGAATSEREEIDGWLMQHGANPVP